MNGIGLLQALSSAGKTSEGWQAVLDSIGTGTSADATQGATEPFAALLGKMGNGVGRLKALLDLPQVQQLSMGGKTADMQPKQAVILGLSLLNAFAGQSGGDQDALTGEATESGGSLDGVGLIKEFLQTDAGRSMFKDCRFKDAFGEDALAETLAGLLGLMPSGQGNTSPVVSAVPGEWLGNQENAQAHGRFALADPAATGGRWAPGNLAAMLKDYQSLGIKTNANTPLGEVSAMLRQVLHEQGGLTVSNAGEMTAREASAALIERMDPTVLERAAQVMNEQMKSGQSPRGVLPDLVYIGGTKNAGRNLSASEQAQIRLLTVPTDGNQNPVATLQHLVQKVRHLQADNPGGENAQQISDPVVEQFIQARMHVPEQTGQPVAPRFEPGMPLTATNGLERVETVRQMQAVLADMAERLQGQVHVDPANLRAVMHLDPPALGRVHVQIQIHDGARVEANVEAENPGTQDFLRQNEQELRQGLSDQGFREDRIEMIYDEHEWTEERNAHFRHLLDGASYRVA